ncbi:MAG TPA: hypothetical protein VHS58_02735 [Acetobacteraceae bacterium]|nr:hypothetical protein [Acetobacteraceae bacterium]
MKRAPTRARTSARAGYETRLASIQADVLLIKWMLGVVLAFQVAIAVKIFVH